LSDLIELLTYLLTYLLTILILVLLLVSFITVMFHLGYLTVCATRAYDGNRALQLEHFLPSQGIILNFIISSRVAYTLQDFGAADFAAVATESIRANVEQVNTVRSHTQMFHVLFQELRIVDVIALHGVTQLICCSVVTDKHVRYMYGLIIMVV